jgi:hypothetical protein
MIPTKVAQLAVFTCAKSAPSHENNRNEKKHPPYNKKFAAVMRKFTASFGINVRRRMRLSSYNLTQARNMINKNQQQTGMNFWNRASFVTFFSQKRTRIDGEKIFTDLQSGETSWTLVKIQNYCLTVTQRLLPRYWIAHAYQFNFCEKSQSDDLGAANTFDLRANRAYSTVS